MSAPGLRRGPEPRDDEPPADTLLSVEEASAFYQLHVETLRGWARTGAVRHQRTSGMILFRRQDLEERIDG